MATHQATPTNQVNLLEAKTFCVVTGGSQGLGRTIAVDLGKRLAPGSVIMLIARSQNNLKQTKSLIEQTTSGVNVVTCPMDLSVQNEEALKQTFRDNFEKLSSEAHDYQQAMVIHCAGTVGPVDRYLCDVNDWVEVAKYFDLHVTSFLVLTSVVLEAFRRVELKTLVNITSLDAIVASKSRGLYGAARAAREMLFRTMAMETPGVRVLNYSPGPVETNMQIEIRHHTIDPEVRKMFIDLHENKQLIKCEDSVTKLMRLLEENTFVSGNRVDYYDI